MSEDEEWTPPTEAEMKVLQAKRERSDKISKLMGDYLLKGYKMLATTCPICSSIELQDRNGAKYCVACQEVDCHETSKDNPAINQRAASRGIAEEAFSSQRANNLEITEPSSSRSTLLDVVGANSLTSGASASPTTPFSTSTHNPDLIPRGQPDQYGARIRITTNASSNNNKSTILPSASFSTSPLGDDKKFSDILIESNDKILRKLKWANMELDVTHSPEKATELVKLIRACVETVHKIQELSS